MKFTLGLVGYGYWGPNLLRNLIAHGGFDVTGVIDSTAEARERCGALYPHIKTFADLGEYCAEKRPEVVVIATPPSSHCELALKCLAQGAHLLVEKPLALSVAECDRIIGAAQQSGKKVMVDHTFAYHPAVQYLARQVEEGAFGDLLYYDSVRVNLGGFQTSTNVLWDLAPHDLSILEMLMKGVTPLSISAVGVRHFESRIENLCYLHLTYPRNFIAHVQLNWVAPVKIRSIVVGGTKKMAVYDDNLPSEKIKLYDKGLVLRRGGSLPDDLRVSYRVGDMHAPALSPREALAGMVAAFHDFLALDKAPPVDAGASRRIVQALELAQSSMDKSGNLVAWGAPRGSAKAA